MSNILLLIGQDEWLLSGLNNLNIKTYVTLPRISLVARILRKIWFKYKLPKADLWFGKWKNDVKDFSDIILFANKMTLPVLYWLQDTYPNKRIIFWYWNPVNKSINPEKIHLNANTELWSFDKNDSEKYNMSYNTSFYLKNLSEKKYDIKKDIFFIGLDKGRYDKLNKLKSEFEEAGINVDLRIVRERNSHKSNKKYSLPLSYIEVIDNIRSSRAILEIMQDGQIGLSLRTFESLYFGKKLITDNYSIKDEPFYNEHNIFILGIDDLSNLKNFIYSEWDTSVNIWCDYYSPKKWLERFSI